MESVENYEKAPNVLSGCGVLRDALLHPHDTFARLPLDGPWLPSTALACVLGAIVWCDQVLSLRAALGTMLANPQLAGAAESPLAKQLAAWLSASDQGWFSTFVTGLPTVPLGLLFYAVGTHVCLVVCRAAGGGLKGTWRVLAYTSTGALLAVLPWVGGLLSLIVVSIQLVAGLAHIHRASKMRVAIALALPLLLIGALIFAVLAVLVTARF